MELLRQELGDMCRLGVLGQISSRHEIDQFLQCLSGIPEHQSLQLDLFDANYLHADLITVLSGTGAGRKQFRIYTYQHQLSQQLLRLGLPVYQVSMENLLLSAPDCSCVVFLLTQSSVDQLIRILQCLPASDATILVIPQFSADADQYLGQLLSIECEYPVEVAIQQADLQKGRICIAPPGQHISLRHEKIMLNKESQHGFMRPSFDHFLQSVGNTYYSSCCVVVLSGYGPDGVNSCKALRQRQACILVAKHEHELDRDECSLPEALKQQGSVDHLLSHEAIASVLAQSIVQQFNIKDRDQLEVFLHAIATDYGYDFKEYQRNSLRRRIENLNIRFGFQDFLQLQMAVFSSSDMFDKMLAEISVPVTQFFRHPEQFNFLRQHGFHYLNSFPVVRIWSAGCATGEEAYSLAMLCMEMEMQKKCRLFATDINPYLLSLARQALFPTQQLEQAETNYRDSGAEQLFSGYCHFHGGYFELDESVRNLPTFHQHSLLHSADFNEFQLIICRNVLIYFDASLQAAILLRFFHALHDDGYLILEPQGMDLEARKAGFMPIPNMAGIYRKRYKE